MAGTSTSNNNNCSNPRYLLGLWLIFLVCIFWGGASVLVQYIYCDLHFPNALFVTFIGSALISLYLPLHLVMERMYARRGRKRGGGGTAGQRVLPWSSGPKPTYATACDKNDGSTNDECHDVHMVEGGKTNSSRHRRTSSTTIHRRRESLTAGTASKGSSNTPSPTSTLLTGPRDLLEDGTGGGSGKELISSPITQNAIDDDYDRDNDDDGGAGKNDVPQHKFLYGHVEHFRTAVTMCPIMLVATVCHDLSLSWTSVTSMMVLSATSTIFAFGFSVLAGDEKFTLVKAAGVGLCVLGSVATALHDSNAGEDLGSEHICGGGVTPADVLVPEEEDAAAAASASTDTTTDFRWRLMGDVAGLISAAGYGAYTTVVRLKCPDDESLSMELLFGYIGLINTAVLAPFVYGGWFTGLIDLSNLSWTVVGFLCLAGLLNDVLSEYLWAKSIVLTSATVANVGLSLTVPIAFLSDWAMGKNYPTVRSTFGALGIVLGFILVTLGPSPSSSTTAGERGSSSHYKDKTNITVDMKELEAEETIRLLDYKVKSKNSSDDGDCGGGVATVTNPTAVMMDSRGDNKAELTMTQRNRAFSP